MAKRIKRIGITGGKGGTGKSTVAVLMANDFVKKGKKVVLVDCDVECPNDYLLIGVNLQKVKKRVYADFPVLDKKKCQKCGLCARTCRENAIFQKPEDYPTFIKDLCSNCGACWIVCPYKAIKTKKEEIGRIYLNKIQNLFLVTGIAKPGLEETGPVVMETKKFALNFAKKIKADYILFDTAAGTHCPVISALLDCDFVYCVTEPTPMGAYDLNLILDLCKKLKIPTKIILNQSNLGNRKLIKKVDKEIPYSKEIVKAYSKGQLLNLNFNF